MDRKKIKQIVRKIITAAPGGAALLDRVLRWRHHRRLPPGSDAKAVFQHHYKYNVWSNAESASGSGSTLEYTANIRKVIPQLLAESGVRVILDAPCGDFNWFRTIEWTAQIQYIGGDIVEDLVKRNRAKYSNDHTTFIDLDIVNDPLPRADLWLCRDCLFHLSEREVLLALDNFVRSDIPYILTSTHPYCEQNTDIPTGSFRLLNLLLPPYSLGPPVRVIDDWIDGFAVRHLALWGREAAKDALATNEAFRRTVEFRHKTPAEPSR